STARLSHVAASAGGTCMRPTARLTNKVRRIMKPPSRREPALGPEPLGSGPYQARGEVSIRPADCDNGYSTPATRTHGLRRLERNSTDFYVNLRPCLPRR